MTSKENHLDSYEFDGTGLTTKEKNQAKQKFEEYKQVYNISRIHELQLLNEKVYREIQQDKIKQKIQEIQNSKAVKDKNLAPSHLVRRLDENLDKIISIDEKLGLFDDKKDTDGYNYIKKLKKKFEMWMKENQASRYFPCPHCSQPVLLRIRPEAWEAQKHPFFKDKVLYNEHLVTLVLEGKITKEDCAKIFSVSPDYVTWLIDKWHKTANATDKE